MYLNTRGSTVSNDELFTLLTQAHEQLSESESRQFDASLVLLLANHISSMEVIKEAIEYAKNSLI
ncbi:hypothetical protein Xmau_01519 [Xenorhabdus mauleonii]|uniref:DUF2783 domain-containing protein n=1 Tax=Xenorhabdus mauleonii TaxID=351675 RepID=A0A1I3PGA7_9GAMM|nr:DUF2783 domain-containing protein [Xenorhabdus mauleonii]PHM44805.1 hypothetical protein Xmau_01519 [Xenorhabdus mauleonii]SFJ20714.1 Protein of unknown function [Xenorhabdus mauleonii]